MAINKNRLNEFMEEMKKISGKPNFAVRFQSVKDNLLDFLAENPFAETTQIRATIESIFPGEYASYMKSVFSNYDNVIELVNTKYADLGFNIQRDFKKLQALEKINQTRLGAYSETAADDIVKTVSRGIADKLTQPELANNLNLLGDKVSFYADTISSTQLQGYSREVKNIKASIAEIEWFQYVGQLRETSREFCQANVGNYFNLEMIKNTGAAEVGKSFINPFSINCGGWNCGHVLEPDPFYEG